MKQENWQQIETAPKHGGSFLAFKKVGGIHFYSIGHYHWYEKYEIGEFRFNPPVHGGVATHWMPLPHIPEQ